MGTGLVAQNTWIPAVRCGDATYGTDVPPDAGATLLQLITHRFSPQGVTGLALLAESHISIHTWPELGYAAVDVFTCGDHTMPEKACRELAARLQAGEQRLQSLRRDTPAGLPTPSRALAGP